MTDIILPLLFVTSVSTEFIQPLNVVNVGNKLLNGPEPRVFGGQPAKENQFPFMIFLYIQGFTQCSASLMKAYWVLTAAHCLEDKGVTANNIFLAGGVSNYDAYLQMKEYLPNESVENRIPNIQERRAVAFYIHPDYTGQPEVLYDIGAIRLEKPFSSPRIQVMPISRVKMRRPMNCTILGFGLKPKSVDSTQLHYAYIIAKTTNIGCQRSRRDPLICLEKGKGKGICPGDSGSPLVCDNAIWGVASHSDLDNEDEDGDFCAPNGEDYYTEVYQMVSWLDDPYNGSNPTTCFLPFKNFLLTSFSLFFLQIHCIYYYNI